MNSTITGILFLCWTTCTHAFVSTTTRPKHPTRCGVETRPVLVVAHNQEAAKFAMVGATLALSAREKHMQQQSTTTNDEKVPHQPVAVLTTRTSDDDSWLESIQDGHPPLCVDTDYLSPNDYERALQQFDTRSISHVVLDGPYSPSPEIRDRVSFLGLQPPLVNVKVEPERARQLGSVLQQILNDDTSSCCVSMDWASHLSLLQANTLPKSTAHGNSYLILPTSTLNDMVLVDYLYDYDRLGGTDPLSCNTHERSIGNDAAVWNDDATYATAAAYSALRGNNVGAVPAACVAQSVGCFVSRNGPSFQSSATAIEQILQHSEQLQVMEGPVVRRKYIEFGYK